MAAVIIDTGTTFAIADAVRYCVRTSTGTLYAAINTGTGTADKLRMYKSTDGTSWTHVDSAHDQASVVYGSIAIDSTGLIHAIFYGTNTTLIYNTFNTATDLWGTSATSQTATGSGSAMIAIDASNKPHVLYSDATASFGSIYYTNKVSGAWSTKVLVDGGGANSIDAFAMNILIDNNGNPQICYIDSTNSKVKAAIGNTNNATSFTVWTGMANNGSDASMCLDSAGNTWIAFCDAASPSNHLNIVKHNLSDAWATWQTPIVVDTTNEAGQPSIVANKTNLYVFCQSSNSGGDINLYSCIGGSWSTKTILDTGAFYNTPVAKWSNFFNNGGNVQLDIIFLPNGGTTSVFWDKYVLPGDLAIPRRNNIRPRAFAPGIAR